MLITHEQIPLAAPDLAASLSGIKSGLDKYSFLTIATFAATT
jgi:hypothetical protein